MTSAARVREHLRPFSGSSMMFQSSSSPNRDARVNGDGTRGAPPPGVGVSRRRQSWRCAGRDVRGEARVRRVRGLAHRGDHESGQAFVRRDRERGVGHRARRLREGARAARRAAEHVRRGARGGGRARDARARRAVARLGRGSRRRRRRDASVLRDPAAAPRARDARQGGGAPRASAFRHRARAHHSGAGHAPRGGAGLRRDGLAVPQRPVRAVLVGV